MIYPDVFDNERRFIFNNWSDRDFTATWANESTTVKAGTSKEFPMYLAYHFTKHFVDREMQKDGMSSLMSIDEQRKSYEDKTMAEITGNIDSPALAQLKEQIRQEIEVPQGEVLVEATAIKKEAKVKKEATKEFDGIK